MRSPLSFISSLISKIGQCIVNRNSTIEDSLIWTRHNGVHSGGDFSIAVVQANVEMEDYSQIEVGSQTTFVGIYDGHGGPDAADFVSRNLFPNLVDHVLSSRTVTENVIKRAFDSTERGFIEYLQRVREEKPQILMCGTCCLVGVLWRGELFVANLGDSRAVMGCEIISGTMFSEHLTVEHDVNNIEIQRELQMKYSDISDIVVFKNGAYRLKGATQVSRAIGDVYLKLPEIVLDPSIHRVQLTTPITKSVMSAIPALTRRLIRPTDRFVIFASDGLWLHLSDMDVVNFVKRNPRRDIAKRLVEAALKRAASRLQIPYTALLNADQLTRRQLHDDISVIVLFFDHKKLSREQTNSVPNISVRGLVDTATSSDFRGL